MLQKCSVCGCMKNIKEGDVCLKCAKEIKTKLKSFQGIYKNDKSSDEEYTRKDIFQEYGLNSPK